MLSARVRSPRYVTRLLLITGLSTVLLGAAVAGAAPPDGWLELLPGSSSGDEPVITVLASDDQHTVLLVEIPGVELATENIEGTEYTELAVPGYGSLGETGFPELPVVPMLVAIPDVAGFEASVAFLDSVVVDSITVMPAPDWEVQYNEEGFPFLVEVFRVDEAFYDGESGGFYPGFSEHPSGTGHMRDQAFCRVEVRPFQFDASSSTLRVFPRVRVALEHGSRGGRSVPDLGPLSGAARVLLGYEGGGARPRTRVAPGDTTWCLSAQNCVDAHADYLIEPPRGSRRCCWSAPRRSTWSGCTPSG